MFIPKTAEYAMRCMAQIALLPWESSISASELNELVTVPRDYLSKILRKLVAAGLLIGEKGHGGGFRLASPPSTISYLKIFEATGFILKPEHCAFGWGGCDSEHPCPLHNTFSELNRQLSNWAATTTLADIEPATHFLTRMKNIAPPVTRQAEVRKPLRKKKRPHS